LYNKELEKQVHNLFKDLAAKKEEIIVSSRTSSDATERIMRMVSSTVSAETEGYMIDLYANLVDRVKGDDFFKDPEHLNAFYRLNLRDDMNEKYQFNIDSIDTYKKGIQYREINNIYASVGAAAGTFAVGGILKFALSRVLNIPFVIIIAGALVAACAAFFAIPTRNKKEYRRAVDRFLADLENEILDWLVEVEVYFDEKVRTLYK
jgi:hypothetical protein